MKKKISTLLVTLVCLISLNACEVTPSTSSEGSGATSAEINIAYQYGLAYAPLVLCQEKGFIEESYKKATGNDVKVTWTQMSSGADINTGIASGSLDVGFMGVAPAISGISKNVGYKIFTNLSGQEHGLMTNSADINSLEDLVGSQNQIALVNIGSIQHIILAKALAENGFDAHSLDSNIVAMKHPDGMTALESGSISCHLTSSPYIFAEHENSELHELPEVNSAWPVENSFIVGVASNDLHDSNPELYNALCSAISDSIKYLNDNPEEVAAITCEFDGNDKYTELEYLRKGVYSPETKGVFELASFMFDNKFVDTSVSSFNDLAFDNVNGD